MAREHNHYFKECPYGEVDVYRVLQLFEVTDPCIQHAVKKLLVAGGRGAGKDISRDITEAIDSLVRWNDMRIEEQELTNVVNKGVDTVMSKVMDGIEYVLNTRGRINSIPKDVTKPEPDGFYRPLEKD